MHYLTERTKYYGIVIFLCYYSSNHEKTPNKSKTSEIHEFSLNTDYCFNFSNYRNKI